MSIFNLDHKPNQLSTDRALAYATRADFQRIFTEDMGAPATIDGIQLVNPFI